MAEQVFSIAAVIQTLENRLHLGESLFFPEVSRFGTHRDRLLEAIRRNAQGLLEQLPPVELYRRRLGDPPTVDTVTVTLDPPPRLAAWRDPVALHFQVVRWSHGDEAHLAFVPALGIEVMAAKPDELEALLPAHIRATLMRTGAATSLRSLVWLQRCRAVRVELLSVTATIRSPKEIARDAERDRQQKKTVLKQVGTNLTRTSLPPAYEADEVVSLLAELLSGRHPRSVLLVGPSGVGKTAAFQELVRRRSALGLGHTPFWATSGARLVAGMSGYGMWQERCQEVWKEAAHKKAVLHLGNLVELMEVGKSEHQSTGIGHFLRPYLARGDLLAVVECTPEQVPLIEREDPPLLGVFQQVQVAEPEGERARAILRQCAGSLPAAAVDTLDRLHRRYATYSAYPGRPLRFLKNLRNDRPGAEALSTADVVAAFARETGLPRFLLDDAVPLDRTAARQWFGARVIGQAEAVDLVVDLLTTVKAGLTRPRKPIASLLFIGPTGVGKTEMAKALAEFLFSDRHRLTRLDMSEYADADAVQRLVGSRFGAEGLLTAKVREQPFAVVLLDEFEKAHPLFFDLLLQVLGEGRLTDAAGRLADFCNAVVIMTSNLGAESFQQGAFGLVRDWGAREQAREHFVREVRRFVRPELFNRIDRIVPFAPLDQNTVRHIADRQLELLRERDGIRYRGVTLTVAAEVAEHLTHKGYDPRYGARPLKRALERELLAPLADQMNHYIAETALAVDARLEGTELRLTVRARLDEAGRQVSAVTSAADVVEAARHGTELRRDCQALERCPAVLELTNDLYQLERLEERLNRRRLRGRPWAAPADLKRLAELSQLRELSGGLKALVERAQGVEEEALLTLYGKLASDPIHLTTEWEALVRRWSELLLALYCRRFTNPDAVTVVVFSEDPVHLFDLTRAYRTVAEARGYRTELYQYTPQRAGDQPTESDEQRQVLDRDKHCWRDWRPGLTGPLERQLIAQPGPYLVVRRAGVIGLALGIRGAAVYPRFEPERGLHEFREKKTVKCLVLTSEEPPANYLPPEGIERRGAIDKQERRRLYDWNTGTAEDPYVKARLTWPGRRLDEMLEQALEERLRADARRLVEP